MTQNLNTKVDDVIYKIDLPEDTPSLIKANNQGDVATIDIDVNTLHKPYRLQNESYEDYTNRRKISNLKRKEQKKGKIFWNSSKLGTYKTSFKVN